MVKHLIQGDHSELRVYSKSSIINRNITVKGTNDVNSLLKGGYKVEKSLLNKVFNKLLLPINRQLDFSITVRTIKLCDYHL